jgi:hypothetical protein
VNLTKVIFSRILAVNGCMTGLFRGSLGHKRPCNKKAFGFTLKAFDLKMWCQLESNQRHKDFQSFALPTELWHRPVVRGILVDGAANVTRFFVSEKLFSKKGFEVKGKGERF